MKENARKRWRGEEGEVGKEWKGKGEEGEGGKGKRGGKREGLDRRSVPANKNFGLHHGQHLPCCLLRLASMKKKLIYVETIYLCHLLAWVLYSVGQKCYHVIFRIT